MRDVIRIFNSEACYSAYDSIPSSKIVQTLTLVYKWMLGGPPSLVARGDVSTGCVVVAECPAPCRRCRYAAMATHDDAVAAGRWVVRGRWQWADPTG